MHATIRLDNWPSPGTFEHRATPRQAITLPILIVLGGVRYSALMRNLSNSGAMIVTSAPLAIAMKIEFQCGTICARSTVLWQRRSDFGIKFDEPICERQLDEQVLRSNAIASWRKVRPLPKVF